MFTDHASSGQPNEQRAAGKATRERRAQLAAFYARQSGRLLQLVRRDLRVDFHVAEDACQTAWVALLHRDDVPLDARGLAWMRIVARTAGYRAARGRETPAGSLQVPAAHVCAARALRSGRLDRGVFLACLELVVHGCRSRSLLSLRDGYIVELDDQCDYRLVGHAAAPTPRHRNPPVRLSRSCGLRPARPRAR